MIFGAINGDDLQCLVSRSKLNCLISSLHLEGKRLDRSWSPSPGTIFHLFELYYSEGIYTKLIKLRIYSDSSYLNELQE